METIIGFVAGYLVGVNGGRDGLQRVRSSWQAIRTSPEVRRLVTEGMAVAQATVGRASRGGLSEVVDVLAARAGARDRRAA
jgi:hypothetical protein